MPNLNVRGIPKDIYDRLKKRAARESRSLNQEVLWLLQQGLAPIAPDPNLWRRIDARRVKESPRQRGTDSVQLLRRDRGRLA